MLDARPHGRDRSFTDAIRADRPPRGDPASPDGVRRAGRPDPLVLQLVAHPDGHPRRQLRGQHRRPQPGQPGRANADLLQHRGGQRLPLRRRPQRPPRVLWRRRRRPVHHDADHLRPERRQPRQRHLHGQHPRIFDADGISHPDLLHGRHDEVTDAGQAPVHHPDEHLRPLRRGLCDGPGDGHRHADGAEPAGAALASCWRD